MRRLFAFAQTCVFSKQSPGPFLCDLLKHREALPEAVHFPKLRTQFAEFLNGGSLERLRILSSPTCVGLRYGRK